MSTEEEKLLRENIKLIKAERRRRNSEKMGKVLKSFGKAIPKGIRHPDSIVTNMHLYHPGYRGKTKLR